MNKINCFLTIALPFFWEGCASIPFLWFSSIIDRIKYSETLEYSEQYFCDQESETNFYFIAACSLSSSSGLLLISLSYIGGGFSVSISKTYTAEIFSQYTFKTFFNIPFAFEAQLCWATPWILTGGNSSAFESQVKLFFLVIIWY